MTCYAGIDPGQGGALAIVSDDMQEAFAWDFPGSIEAAADLEARNKGNLSAAVQAEVARGKAAGIYKTQLEVSGRDGGPITTKKLDDYTDEELLALATGSYVEAVQKKI